MPYDVPKSEGETDPEFGAAGETSSALYEVFVRASRGLNHVHVGSVHASDDEQAAQAARDVYTRRAEGVSVWVVRSTDVHASDPDDQDAWFSGSHPYRHPTFYDIPDEVGHM